jgi:predicted metalloprotease with PDZ domain
VKRSAIVLLAAAASAGVVSPSSAAERVTIAVDMTRAPEHIVHTSMRIPAKPGTLTLRYPKWLPGEHGPNGPIRNLTGLMMKAGGRDLGWRRNPKDMYAFLVEVPEGASSIDVALDVLLDAEAAGFSTGASATPKLAVLSWNEVVLYPAELKANAVDYEASVTLPAGWGYGTALPIASSHPPSVAFAPVSLSMLVDSPVLAGANVRTIPLDERPGRSVVLDMAADDPGDLAIPDRVLRADKRLVQEADALFGTRHFASYHFLMSISDHVAHFGLEHHQSSDDRVRERSFLDPDYERVMLGLLPHEYVHSWNGKYRRPAGLMPDDYGATIDSSLLWVYEGLTQYLGWVLAARSGLRTSELALEDLAMTSAELDARGGRSWRDLEDTAVAAQLLVQGDSAWGSWRRLADYYNEGTLIWLEADVTIRKLTHGAKSIDDFCKRFHGGGSGLAEVKPYTFPDVVADLSAIAPYDWEKFLRDRLTRRSAGAPLAGIEAAGWTLSYSDTRSAALQSQEAVREIVDVRYSLGLLIDKEARVVDVVPGTHAWTAGITPAMKIVAVDGRRYSKEILRAAIRATKDAPATIKLLIENDEFFKEIPVEVRGGERYPKLTRADGTDDVLAAILAPKAEATYNNAAPSSKR